MTEKAGSGSICQRHGSADPDPDPPQNVMDWQHCCKIYIQYVGSRRMWVDPDIVPPLPGFRLFAILGVFAIFSLCLLYAFLILLTVVDLFVTLGLCSTTLFEEKFFYQCFGFRFTESRSRHFVESGSRSGIRQSLNAKNAKNLQWKKISKKRFTLLQHLKRIFRP